MSVLTALELEGFRGFKRLRIEEFTRVNVFVGLNNVGKSAVLEGAEILLTRDTGLALARVASRRRELVRDGADQRRLADVRHLFPGHDPHPGTKFRISAETATAPRHVLVTWTTGATVDLREPSLQFPISLGEAPRAQALAVDRSPNPEISLYAISPAGGLVWVPSASMDSLVAPKEPPVVVMTGDPRDEELARLWERVALTPAEERVIEALRFIEPELARVAVIGADAGYATLRNRDTRLPLASMGDGFHRVLVLALMLEAARGGFLLIDEIENGLHWSVMPKVWRFLSEGARALDVQIFATTHSKDCLEAIANLHDTTPDLARETSVYRIEQARDTPIRFDASRVAEYLRLELEAR